MTAASVSFGAGWSRSREIAVTANVGIRSWLFWVVAGEETGMAAAAM